MERTLFLSETYIITVGNLRSQFGSDPIFSEFHLVTPILTIIVHFNSPRALGKSSTFL